VELGVTEQRFWTMTPRMFHALHRRYWQGEKRADYRAGVVASLLANIHRDEKKRPTAYKPEDFFASLKGGGN
jgi:hypothetical protein